MRDALGPPGLSSVFLAELQHWKLQRVHAGHVLLHPLTLERAVGQLVDDDSGHTDISGRVPTNAARDRRGRVVEQTLESGHEGLNDTAYWPARDEDVAPSAVAYELWPGPAAIIRADHIIVETNCGKKGVV